MKNILIICCGLCVFGALYLANESLAVSIQLVLAALACGFGAAVLQRLEVANTHAAAIRELLTPKPTAAPVAEVPGSMGEIANKILARRGKPYPTNE